MTEKRKVMTVYHLGSESHMTHHLENLWAG